ncbi:hypothetical protein FOS14_12765 [Skermania sp. ID1734]|uniref:hypothetical protein n=1 Tax=Skermania sp. ID1734 TaxID=2597516 RepID=UPI00117C63A8|nr:hypothetical protein [Skermania sp. ID1734]TSD99228.1 hypothetical protein FOS14_12765 [Skermania sp. ID1734]
MNLVRKSSTNGAVGKDDAATLSQERNPVTYGSALRQVGAGATALAMGSGGIGMLLARNGFDLAKRGVARAREARRDLAELAAMDAAAVADTPKVSRPRALLVVGGVAAAVLAGGAVFGWSRRRHTPPPAAEPPRLGEPSSNGVASTQQAPAPTSQPG